MSEFTNSQIEKFTKELKKLESKHNPDSMENNQR